MKKILLVLGNGFSIDFVNYLNLSDKIDLTNLFKFGYLVPWPENKSACFLSYKNCKNLWSLGARPNIENSSAISLVEEIISCANMISCCTEYKRNLIFNSQNIYACAYSELVVYLKHLFIYYNSIVTPNMIKQSMEWSWAKKLKSLYDDPDVESVTIISYNYDIFLERILHEMSIDFSILHDCGTSKFRLIKPHGSISFVSNKGMADAPVIRYNENLIRGDLRDFKIAYDDKMKQTNLINALIPPAGDSARTNVDWASELNSHAIEAAKNLTSGDTIIICGISYWHVDRKEIDEILLSAGRLGKEEINVIQVNPSPSTSLNSVLSCLFDHMLLTSSSALEGFEC